MRTKALLLFLLIATGVFSQESPSIDTVFNQVDHLHQKQGFWKKSYRNGSLAYKGFFKDDKPRGEFIRYHENGMVSALMLFTECGDTARVTLFNNDGKAMAKGKYLRTKKHGVWNYYGQNKSIVFTEEYNEGMKHGNFITYYPTGEVYEKISWKGDLKNGPTVQYYPGGTTKSMLFYVDGLEDGPIRTYFLNGEVRLEGQYSKGLKEGFWKIYSADNKVIKEYEYSKGIAANFDELVEKETRELDALLKNIGKIQEPTIEDFVRAGGY